MTQNEIALKILNMGKDGYKDDAEGFEKLNKANKLIEEHVTERLRLYGVSVSLPSDPMVLAEYLHDNYEQIAKRTNWQTQKSCKVEFKDLPIENKNTMILLAGKLILDFVIAEISISNSKVCNYGRPMMEIPRAKECECEFPVPIADLNQDENGNITHSLCDRCSGIISNAT